MNKEELIEAICEKKGLNSEVVGPELSWAYDWIFAEIVQTVAQGEVVEIPGFGRFCAEEKDIIYVNRSGTVFGTSFRKRTLLVTFSPDCGFTVAVRKGGD